MAKSFHPVCVFCNSLQLELRFLNSYHPLKKNYGPFNIYTCHHCHSLITFPLPTEKQLAELYNSFNNGLMPALREIRDKNSLTVWYDQCIKRATAACEGGIKKEFTWMDIGAGGGELAVQMAKQFPQSKGWAIDFHERPELLNNIKNVQWIRCDLNDEEFAKQLNITTDMVFSITVLEHVLHPDVFLKNGMKLVKPGGVFYFTAPCANSFASKLLGKHWPYFIPGEHLNIPSLQGLQMLLQRLEKDENQKMEYRVNATTLPYTLGYYLSFLKLNFLKNVLPVNLPVKLPTGIVEATIKFR